jgi:hypothetical protein
MRTRTPYSSPLPSPPEFISSPSFLAARICLPCSPCRFVCVCIPPSLLLAFTSPCPVHSFSFPPSHPALSLRWVAWRAGIRFAYSMGIRWWYSMAVFVFVCPSSLSTCCEDSLSLSLHFYIHIQSIPSLLQRSPQYLHALQLLYLPQNVNHITNYIARRTPLRPAPPHRRQHQYSEQRRAERCRAGFPVLGHAVAVEGGEEGGDGGYCVMRGC